MVLRPILILGFLAGIIAAQPAPPSGLAIERFAFHQYEDGPVLPGSYEFLPGETVWISCRITGFRPERKDDEQHVRLSWQLAILDPAGVAVDHPKSGKIEDRLLPEDKDWRPKFLLNFQIPGFGIGGTYKIPVTIHDEAGKVDLEKTFEFHVKGPEDPKAKELGIRDLRFFRNENDTSSLGDPVFRPGTMLWAKFDIVGFKLGENNKLSVSYGLAVLDAEGKELFAQPDAASDTKESFYPQRWVPGTLSLNLQPNVPATNYILQVTATDKIAGTTTEVRHPFRVE